MARTKLVAGNWKMHGSLAANAVLLEAVSGFTSAGCEAAVCVPFPYLAQVRDLLAAKAVAWGAQDVSVHEQGAYTGEVSAAMLADFGCKYVIVGHSERRAYHGESDELVAKKFLAAQGKGLVPILCVGETLAEREAGQTEAVVLRQLDAVLAQAGIAAFAKAVVAYEPVWAIGTGKTASPQQAQEVHAVLRARLSKADAAIASGVKLLYGGSVKGSNAAELFAMADIDGGLVGGAALQADDFLAICRAAAQ